MKLKLDFCTIYVYRLIFRERSKSIWQHRQKEKRKRQGYPPYAEAVNEIKLLTFWSVVGLDC
jgi:hypothetical protein